MADDFAGLKRKSKKGRSQAAEDIVLPGAEDLRPKEPEVEDAAPAPTSSVPLPEDQPLDDFSDLKKKVRSRCACIHAELVAEEEEGHARSRRCAGRGCSG